MAKKNLPVTITLIAVLCIAQIILFRSKVDLGFPIIYRLLLGLAAIVVTLPVHELIHWCFMRLFGLKDARIEFARDPLGLPSLRTIASGKLPRIRRIIVLLAPFVLLTVIPDIFFFLADKIVLFFFLVAICNAAGCCFDIMDALK